MDSGSGGSFASASAIRGTAERPRLTVFRSHKNLACQIIDDAAGKTLVSAGTLDADLRTQVKYGGNKAAAQAIGKAIAERRPWPRASRKSASTADTTSITAASRRWRTRRGKRV